jgi:hypothetical protein
VFDVVDVVVVYNEVQTETDMARQDLVVPTVINYDVDPICPCVALWKKQRETSKES